MDFWKLMDILHKRQQIMNPMRSAKFDRFIKTLDLPLRYHVLDVGCGKGEFLIRLHKMYTISGVGIDKSPFCIQDCNENKEIRAPNAPLEFIT